MMMFVLCYLVKKNVLHLAGSSPDAAACLPVATAFLRGGTSMSQRSRDARRAVLLHAAESHGSESEMVARPTHAALGVEALRELHAHMERSAALQARLKGAESPARANPLRMSMLGVRCTEAWVVAAVLSQDLRAAEQGIAGAAAAAAAERERMRTLLDEADESSRRREGALHARVTHECWMAREEEEASKRFVNELQVVPAACLLCMPPP